MSTESGFVQITKSLVCESVEPFWDLLVAEHRPPLDSDLPGGGWIERQRGRKARHPGAPWPIELC